MPICCIIPHTFIPLTANFLIKAKQIPKGIADEWKRFDNSIRLRKISTRNYRIIRMVYEMRFEKETIE